MVENLEIHNFINGDVAAMISDIVCEQLVQRKLTPMRILTIAGVTVGGILLSFFLYVIGGIADPAVGMMASLFFLGGIALTVFLVRRMLFVEYEYTFVNGELTVDKILTKSSRKNLAEIDVKAIEKLGKYDAETVAKLGSVQVWDYSADKADENTLYAFFKDDASGRNTVLFFTPNQKLLDAMKPYVSATVYREAFRK